MTPEDANRHFETFVVKQTHIMKSKQEDYAEEGDILSNFKLSAGAVGITPEQQCLSLIATKVVRLGVLLKSGTPNNESIKDSVIDMANYTVKLDQLLSEGEQPLEEEHA